MPTPDPLAALSPREREVKPPTLTEIAARICAHLRRFEADPAVNKRRNGLVLFYGAGAFRAGSYVGVKYISYQSTSMLKKREAMRYLKWLDAGNVGRHYNMPPTPKDHP